MRIAILGGTGDLGEGLALRWGRDTAHELLLGSRDPERAREAAAAYEATLADHGVDRTIKGFANEMAADRADVVVLAVPSYHARDTIEAIADRLDASTVLVSPANGLTRDDDGFRYDPPPAGSVTALVADCAPEGVPVVGAYHNLPAGRLADLADDLGLDTPLVGDDEDARALVAQLTGEIEGLRALEAGPIANAAAVEGLVPLVLNVARYTDETDVSVRFR